MKPVTRRLWAGVVVGLLASSCFAGTSAGFMSVGVTLYNPGFVPSLLPPERAGVPGAPPGAVPALRPGVCISEALGRQAQALVRVACGSGQFVSIVPMPGKPFLGAHGGAFRYTMGTGAAATVLASDAGVAYLGVGTVTALRVFNANDPDGLLELLVSF